MAVLYYESQICHHGIKGQRWGIRRFQDKKGRLTKAGKERYGTSHRKTARSIYDYGKNFPTDVPIDYDNNAWVEFTELFDSGNDFVLKKGNHLYRITNCPSEVRGKRYVTALMKDADTYSANFDSINGDLTKSVYRTEYTLKKNIKVAGVREQVKYLLDAYGYKKDADAITSETTIDELYDLVGYDGKYKGKVDLDIVMKNIPARDKFIDRLSKEGYDAVVDMTDSSPIGIGMTITPMILLDSGTSVDLTSNTKLWQGWTD